MPVRPSIESELRYGTRVLEEAGILNPKREATAIWASLAGVRPGDVWLDRGNEAGSSLSASYRDAVVRRARGEPFPYVVGLTGFRTLIIKVDRRALIPRPETEGLVCCVLEWCNKHLGSDQPNWGTAVDVGTGTGCIALSLAVEGKFERLVATDSSKAALELAAENVEKVAPNTDIELRQGSLLDAVEDITMNVVVANPPYVTSSEYEDLESSVSRYEPREALVSGTDGLAHTKELLERGAARLTPGGLIAIEVDSTRAETVRSLACRLGWQDVRIEPDIFGRPRFLLATKEN